MAKIDTSRHFNILKRYDELLFAAGWNDAKFARESGIPYSTIKSWREMSHEITFRNIEKICNTFSLTLPEFFAGSQPGDEEFVVITKWHRIPLAKRGDALKILDVLAE